LDPRKLVFGISGGATAAAAGFGVTGESGLAEAPPAKSVAAMPSAPTPDATFQDHLLLIDMMTTPCERNMTVR
jgi:hypothetical protein